MHSVEHQVLRCPSCEIPAVCIYGVSCVHGGAVHTNLPVGYAVCVLDGVSYQDVHQQHWRRSARCRPPLHQPSAHTPAALPVIVRTVYIWGISQGGACVYTHPPCKIQILLLYGMSYREVGMFVHTVMTPPLYATQCT